MGSSTDINLVSLEFNPFSESDANDETHFFDYMIESNIQHELIKKESYIFLGIEGSGKTACFKILQYICNEKLIGKDVFHISITKKDFHAYRNIIADKEDEIGNKKNLMKSINEKFISRFEELKIEFTSKFYEPDEIMKDIIKSIKLIGYNNLFFLIDIGIKLSDSKDETDNSIDYIHQLVKLLQPFEIIFKIFMPMEINYLIRKKSNLKKIETVELDWDLINKKLVFKNIIEKRLLFASTYEDPATTPINNFNDSLGGKLVVSIEDQVIKKSKTPRDLIKKCNRIMELLPELQKVENKGFLNAKLIDAILEAGEESEQPKSYISPGVHEEATKRKKIKTILHVSDLHMQSEAYAFDLLDTLVYDLNNNIKTDRLDYCAITGDIVASGYQSEYEIAYEFIRGLSERLNIAKEQIVITPGNHDLNYNLSKNSYINIELNDKISLPAGKYTWIEIDYPGKNGIWLRYEDDRNNKWRFYSNFHEKIYGRRFDFNNQAVMHRFKDDKLLFLSLNSAWQIDAYHKDKAGIYEDGLDRTLKEMNKDDDSDWLKVALWHHPPDRLETDRFIDKLVKNDFSFCLHGHLHANPVEHKRRFGIPVLGAGSFGMPHSRQASDVFFSYNVLEINQIDNIMKVFTRKKENPDEPWRPDCRWGKDGKDDFYTIDLENQSDETKK